MKVRVLSSAPPKLVWPLIGLASDLRLQQVSTSTRRRRLKKSAQAVESLDPRNDAAAYSIQRLSSGARVRLTMSAVPSLSVTRYRPLSAARTSRMCAALTSADR